MAHRTQVLKETSEVVGLLSLLPDAKTPSTKDERYPWEKTQHNLKCKASCFLVEPTQIEATLNLVLFSSHHVVGECALLC